MKNVYYDPEAFGLEIVGQFDWSLPDWSFDMCVVWNQDGKYWIGNDSGCSCPAPFEEVYDINELDGPYDKDGLRKRLDWLVGEHKEDGYYDSVSQSELKKSVREILARI